MEYPHLIENTAKNYLFNTLRRCHDNRVNIYYYIFNIGIFLIFSSIFGYVLYYCYTHKLSDFEKERRMLKDQQYIMSKIRFYQEESNERKTSNITNLPFTSDNKF
jgi:hypothetical protein